MHKYCVILAGGTGLHFWPLTREDFPKPFMRAGAHGVSFVQLTYRRALESFPEDHIYIVSLAKYRGLLFEQFPDISEDHLLLEPYGRGTATSIAFATYTLMARDPEAVMVVTPCDHFIKADARFNSAINKALDYAASNDALIALGIVPTEPNPNFGYVQVEGGREAWHTGIPIPAKTFTEKPSEELARIFVDSGEFLWNSGIFVWKASAIREEMHGCCPEITKLWKGWEKALGSAHEARFIERVYSDSPNNSIDYAVLEKSNRLTVLPCDFDWADIGSYSAYYDYTPAKDADGNVIEGVSGKLFIKDTSGSMLYCDNPRKLMIVRGLKDFLVVDTGDVLIICPKDDETLRDTSREMKRPEFEEYR